MNTDEWIGRKKGHECKWGGKKEEGHEERQGRGTQK